MARRGLRAVVLLGRGSYGGGVGELLVRLGGALRERGCWPVIREAVVDRGGPSLPEALSACARNGASRILVVPVSFSIEPALFGWLEKVAARWRKERERAPEVIFTETPLRQFALAEQVRRVVDEAQTGAKGAAREVALLDEGRPVLEDPPAWSEVPFHERHVLACSGPRCTARGSDRLWRHLRRELRKRRLVDGGTGTEKTLIAHTGCLYPCSLGPMLIVYPDGIWYGVSGPQAVERIVADHLVGGEVVEEYAYALGKGCVGAEASGENEILQGAVREGVAR